VLEEAAHATSGARRKRYGHPITNHGRTAALWSVYLRDRTSGSQLTARDVCMLNILQKISRDCHRPSRDNLVDIAGYAANAELCDDAYLEGRLYTAETGKVQL
jgi:hypothetical protein